VVDLRLPAVRSARTGGTTIATAKKRKTSRTTRPAPSRASRTRAGKTARGPSRKSGVARGGSDHPLGMGVADGFAMDRLSAPARMRRTPKQGVREIGWAAFGEVARALAATIGEEFRPDVVIGIAKGGVFVGGALAAALGAEFHPVRIEKRRRDPGPLPGPTPQLPDLSGRRALVVDDVAASGATLAKARALARKAGAREVWTAVLIARPKGGARPDWSALETEELILFGWDYQLDEAGAGPEDPGEVGV
jgi:uncharacterized protein